VTICDSVCGHNAARIRKLQKSGFNRLFLNLNGHNVTITCDFAKSGHNEDEKMVIKSFKSPSLAGFL
jgi:hypothetical protein